jgi:hypothetical protein
MKYIFIGFEFLKRLWFLKKPYQMGTKRRFHPKSIEPKL